MTTDHTARERADEIVQALKLCACDDGTLCTAGLMRCPYGENVKDCIGRLTTDAADLIQSLAAEVCAAKDAARAAQDANSEAGNTITQIQAELWEVQAELDELRRRERKAVRDFEIVSEDDLCSVCTFIGQCVDTDSCCFRWRGSPAQPSSDESGTTSTALNPGGKE